MTVPGYEPRDASPLLASAVLAGFLALVAVGALAAWALAAAYGRPTPPTPASPFAEAAVPRPAPRLESNPRADRLALEQAARARLRGYAWADRKAGLARIPIERAMAMQASQGWPDADLSTGGAP